GFSPAPVAVEWLVDGVPGLLLATATRPRRRDGAAGYAASSRTNVSRDDWLEGKTYTCQVKHAGSNTVVQDHARNCAGEAPARGARPRHRPGLQPCNNAKTRDVRGLGTARGPGTASPSRSRSPCPAGGEGRCTSSISTYVLPPSPAGLYMRQDGKLLCVIVNLPSDAGLQVLWSREKPGALHPESLALREQFNGTYTAVSALAVTQKEWESGERFTCTVKHEELQAPIAKSVANAAGSPAPRVFAQEPHAEEVAQGRVSLGCLIRGFYPAEVSVQWLRDHDAVPEGSAVTTPPLREGPGDSSFFVYSKMTVPLDEWQRGSTFACMVVHEALPMKFTQRSLQRGPGK
uniref:Ig-like domain-containing protein n=1 Tax=Dromaius novaehollandiae TaxID=8790 RepID=A0A8C4KF51_DRONO